MAADYILYGGDHSYYTGKVRAYMRFKDLDWEEVTASRAVYKSTILPQIGAAIVPVLATADGQFVQDTTDIIDFLEAAHPAVSVYPDTPVQKLVALHAGAVWRRMADHSRHALSLERAGAAARFHIRGVRQDERAGCDTRRAAGDR